MSSRKKSGPDPLFGVSHQEMLVEGGKLKELAEEESVKSLREQRKMKLGKKEKKN